MQEMCKQAHAIHRGGMFMLERIRYLFICIWYKNDMCVVDADSDAMYVYQL